MRNFRDKVAVVTGGASGIGYALAEALLAEGAKVVLADIEEGALDAACTALSGKGGEVLGVRTDVADQRSIEELAQRTVDRFGGVNLLCNNAGVGGFQRFESTSREMWEWTLAVDLWGVIDGTRIFLPLLKEQEDAHILNTASMSGFCYGPFLAPYSVAKAGVVALTESLYREFRYTKVNVGLSVLCPAYTATNIGADERNAPADVVLREEADPALQQVRDHVDAMVQAGKSAAEVAAIALDGIRADKLHIIPHQSWLEAVEERIGNILAGRPVGDEPASVLADPTR
ncbi:SDR family NAD(P)-dependent oxidoreductase [Novosphingobium naphthalenivorans]|uniref:SDR family NAD(P)-dependent oxidoreductase n=1 Tax=Novosphingobium naphthalenivorans TaxID=273168 RepID=UPI0008302328|nr:SDR family NAD(P)-dependent oxidoreductase [Novosphingobium naphthalenivorans]